jgi:hypothetical protein
MACFKPKWVYCEVRIACDGDTLGEKRKDKGMCGKCEEKQKKRAKPEFLRGSGFQENPSSRKAKEE